MPRIQMILHSSQATLDDAATHPLAIEFREAMERAGVEEDGVAPCDEGLIKVVLE
jgi:hypothetical protein